MASIYWVGAAGAGGDNFQTNTLWRNTSDDTPATNAPQSDDIIYFDHRAVRDCTAGMDNASVDLQQLNVTSGFRYSIGASGAPLIIAVSNATTATPTATLAPSEGTIYWQAGTANVDDLFIERTSSKGVFLTGGTFTEVYLQSGIVNQGASCVIPTLHQAGGMFTSANGTAITTYRQVGGRSALDRTVTTGHILGGTTECRDGGTFTTLNTGPASNIKYLGGSITNFNYYGGVFDPTGNPRDITLGSSSGTIYYGSPGRFVEQVAGIEITVSATKLGKKSPGM